MESANSLANISLEEVRGKEKVHVPFNDSCDLGKFSCAFHIRVYFDWLNLKQSTSSVGANIGQSKKKKMSK